jgi:hypothetical protein
MDVSTRITLRGAPPERPRQIGFGTAEAGQTPGALLLDERLQGFANEAGFLLQARESLGFGDELVVQSECRAHDRGLQVGHEKIIV